MAFSLMNGLSAMGQGIAAFAGTAGLEAQKSALQAQNIALADTLAGQREQNITQPFQASQQEKQLQSAQDIEAQRSSTSLQVAGIQSSTSLQTAGIAAAAQKYSADVTSKDVYAQIAAAEPGRQADILQKNQQTALEAVQTHNAQALTDARTALQTEEGKDAPDPTKVATLKSQVTSLETSATTEAATTTAAAGMYRTDMDAVTHYNTQLVTATNALNSMPLDDAGRDAQKGLVANLQKQLAGAQRALEYSSSLVHGRVAGATGNAPMGVAPTMPAGVPPGARYSPTLKIWQAPDGRLFDQMGQPTTNPGAVSDPSRGLINGAVPPS